jgi:outer membrane receptor for ferrienterochelin and colicins
MPSNTTRRRRTSLICLAAAVHAAASAQTPAPPQPQPAPQQQPQPQQPQQQPQAAQPAPVAPQQVEITGQRNDETQERRQSTAAKIVVGRTEIERYGDANVGDLLRRLPGVTVQGSTRRGAQLRMRGLGSGYTQILLDGERVPATFSIDSLSPDQIERIEILRAPTAETGTRAIAGTINIITREGGGKRSDEVRLGVARVHGQWQPAASWSHADRRPLGAGDLIYSGSLQLQNEFSPLDTDSESTVEDRDLSTGATTFAQRESTRTSDKRNRVNLSTRIQWRNDSGDGLTLTPLLTFTRDDTKRRSTLTQSAGTTAALYDTALSDADNKRRQFRLGARWRSTFGEGAQLELRAGVRDSRGSALGERQELDAVGIRLRGVVDSSTTRERNNSLGVKLSDEWGDDHAVTLGAEAENARRSDTRTTLQNGLPLLTEFGDDLTARSSRYALYAQDEWTLAPEWILQAGLRSESITTRGDAGLADVAQNRSRVLAPLMHLLWKPNAADRVRLGLTRSYRSASLSNLLGRPALSTRYPVSGPNLPTSPDRVGNPALKPELANGVDLGWERYVGGGGVVGANLFHRRIRDVIRTTTALETVPWSTV